MRKILSIFFFQVFALGNIFSSLNTPNFMNSGLETATLGGGCFWCTEAVYKDVKGVTSVMPGYAGGFVKNPAYREVCTGNTGHAEVIQLTFDPSVISYSEILNIFFSIHDPTTLNRQGNDIGTQYRSVIFYHSPEQKQTAENMIKDLSAKGKFDDPVVTAVEPFTNFYRAEDYHIDYFAKNPDQAYCSFVVKPKVDKFRKNFIDMLK